MNRVRILTPLERLFYYSKDEKLKKLRELHKSHELQRSSINNDNVKNTLWDINYTYHIMYVNIELIIYFRIIPGFQINIKKFQKMIPKLIQSPQKISIQVKKMYQKMEMDQKMKNLNVCEEVNALLPR